MDTDGKPVIPQIAFEALRALHGFCFLENRSGSLGGSLPLRAVQYCEPAIEGSAAGFQISLDQPISIRRTDGTIEIDMTPPAFEQTQGDVKGVVEELVESGLLPRDGYWHQLFKEDAMPVRGDRIFVWTGFLVRPTSGIWLLVSSAFNRRSRIDVVEHVLADANEFAPLVLETDVSGIGGDPVWLEREIGCVLPLLPQATMSLERFEDHPDVGRSFSEFYDDSYFAEKAERPTGRYRRLLAKATKEAAPRGDSLLVFAGPDVHSVERFERFSSASGFSEESPGEGELEFGVLRNIAAFGLDWDGQSIRSRWDEIESHVEPLERVWRSFYGETSESALEFLRGYWFEAPRDEPFCNVHPWVFGVSPPGWSTLVDGYHVGGLDGWRGVLASDLYHGIVTVYKMFEPAQITVPSGVPLMRVLPIPRELLRATVELVEFGA